jgi:hypothetical protein
LVIRLTGSGKLWKKQLYGDRLMPNTRSTDVGEQEEVFLSLESCHDFRTRCVL